jgi:hypothetical protein
MVIIFSKVWFFNSVWPKQYHSIVNVLSILPKFTKIVGVLDHTLDTLLFFMQPIWLQEKQYSMVLYNIDSLVMIANMLKTW